MFKKAFRQAMKQVYLLTFPFMLLFFSGLLDATETTVYGLIFLSLATFIILWYLVFQRFSPDHSLFKRYHHDFGNMFGIVVGGILALLSAATVTLILELFAKYILSS